MNSEDMKERTEMGGNATATKYVHDKISQMIWSNRIVC
jgi:hypothetical protein